MSVHPSGPAQVGHDNRSVRLKGRRLVTLLSRRISDCERQESVGAEGAASGRLRQWFIASLRNDTRRVPSEWPESAPRQNTGKLDRCTQALTAANFLLAVSYARIRSQSRGRNGKKRIRVASAKSWDCGVDSQSYWLSFGIAPARFIPFHPPQPAGKL